VNLNLLKQLKKELPKNATNPKSKSKCGGNFLIKKIKIWPKFSPKKGEYTIEIFFISNKILHKRKRLLPV
jgi:hypothetical protein